MCRIRILKLSTRIDMKLKCIYLKRQVILIIQQHDADMEAEYIFIVLPGVRSWVERKELVEMYRILWRSEKYI